MQANVIALTRDCEATEIPYGGVQLLPTGTKVRIMQSLGGSYTVTTEQGAMMRIEAKNADLTKGFTQLAVELIALDQWVEQVSREFCSELPLANARR